MSAGPPPARRRGWRWLAYAGIVLALTLVFTAYRNPHLIVDLGQAVWSCF